MVRPVEALDGDGDEDEDEDGDEDVDEDGDDQGSTWAGFFSICLGICETARARRRPPPGKYFLYFVPGPAAEFQAVGPKWAQSDCPRSAWEFGMRLRPPKYFLYFVRVRGALVPGARTV